MSVIERGGRCSLNVAIAIEDLSNGRIDAADLNDDVRAARAKLTDVVAPFNAQTIICAHCERNATPERVAACVDPECPRAVREAA